MTEQYQTLAAYYDRIMADIDYPAWADFYRTCFDKYDCTVRRILDLACGTGSITVPLACAGYDVTGLDLSAEMLTLAEEKAERAHVRIRLSEQNIALFDAGRGYDAAICSFDGYNYLTKASDVTSSFARVYESLNDGGLFIFDVSTPYKYENILSDNAYVYEYDDLFLSWQNYFNRKSGLCDFYLTFFLKNGAVWHRVDEYQRQRRYPLPRLRKMAEAAGFTVLETVSDLNFAPVDKTSERAFFLCKK
ncbi:MAG: methyltransferase domain-containing protein [Clostridia bacterium]|nr:methyltransferase domain-containing protein [Clostridia bacterium]